MTSLILTILGADRPGLVEALAAPIAAHGGNWLESRMAHLAGKFAGILRLEVEDAQAAPLTAALTALEARGLKVLVERDDAPPPPVALRFMVVELEGLDRPGLVKEIAAVLAERGVNIEELQTDRTTAPMSGEAIFRSRAWIHVPARVDADELRGRLERLAGDLMVQVTLGEPS
ncbi:MAG: ACT domain-containing protein [Anaeromyxobacteraceae bacterium]|nr:ACT domain-containing protein [Anaeromyxobacteraceae bacterium]